MFLSVVEWPNLIWFWTKIDFKENAGLVVPWIVGLLTFMSLEAVATM